jgi:hypothetical protein
VRREIHRNDLAADAFRLLRPLLEHEGGTVDLG